MKVICSRNSLISSQDWDCPSCGHEASYGVLGVNDDHYLRKCRLCNHGNCYHLPKLKKRIVYVDQFALSLMMKVLDPDRKGQKRAAVDPFYRKLFEQLDRLGKLMLMVCPYSPIHQIESKGLAKLASPEDIQSDKDAEGVVFRERFEKVRGL